MDAGAFGCLGVGTPYAIAATVIDIAVRHSAKAVLIVSNNAAWNIER